MSRVSPRPPAADVLDAWLAELPGRVRPKTAATYAQVVDSYLRPAWGTRPFASLGPADVRAAVARAAAPRTAQLVFVVARLALGAEWPRVLAADPRGLKAPRVDGRPRPTWSRDEAGRFLAVAEADRLAALWDLAITTGLRHGELLALRWSDYDPATGALSVQRQLSDDGVPEAPKTPSAYRVVTVPPRTRAALARHRAAQARRGLAFAGAIFTNRDGGYLHRTNVRRAFARLSAKAGVPAIHFHDLRHTCATLMLAGGVPVKVVQVRLGHSSAATTLQVYAHVTPGQDAAAAGVLEAALG